MRLEVHTVPGSSATRVGGEHGGRLVVRVTQRAVDGKATEAVRRAVADALGVPARDVAVLAGATSRRKVLLVEGPDDELAAACARLMEGGH